MEAVLYSYLSNYGGLTSLVGIRIYPVFAPKGVAFPYVVFFKVSNVRTLTHDGVVNFQKARMQISCYSEDYYTIGALIGVKQIAEQVIAAMEAWSGATSIPSSQHEGEQDLIDPGTKLYHVPLDFFVIYTG